MKSNTIAKIMEKLIAKSIFNPEEDGCWEWTGARTQNGFGYGTINLHYKKWATHRISWVIHNRKQIPKGMEVCHTCDNHACWRPDHLFIGTHKDNMQDMARKHPCDPNRAINKGEVRYVRLTDIKRRELLIKLELLEE